MYNLILLKQIKEILKDLEIDLCNPSYQRLKQRESNVYNQTQVTSGTKPVLILKCTEKIKFNQSKKYRKKTLYKVLIIIQSLDGVQSGEKKLNITIEETNEELDIY